MVEKAVGNYAIWFGSLITDSGEKLGGPYNRANKPKMRFGHKF